MPADALHRRSTLDEPAAVRYPRGAGPGVAVEKDDDARCRSARARCRAREGRRVAILAFGTMLQPALEAPRSSMRRSPTCASSSRSTTRSCVELARTHALLVTVEENVVDGRRGQRGGGERSPRPGIAMPVLQLGLPDRFIDHGDPDQLLATAGLDADGILAVDPQASRRGRAGERRSAPPEPVARTAVLDSVAFDPQSSCSPAPESARPRMNTPR